MTPQLPWYKRSETYALCVVSIMLISFIGLTPLGRWQHDEFYTITLFRDGGIMTMVRRVLFWSPRPVSEIPLIFYLYLTEWLGRPLIGPALAAVWVSMYGLVLWAALKAGDRKLLPAAFGLALLFMVIAGRNNSDALFWVQGAFAYAPTIAFALALSLFSIFKPSMIRDFTWTYVFLSIGLAFSSESGAFLVFFHALLMPVYLLFRDRDYRLPSGTKGRMLAVLSSAILVIVLITNARGSVVEQDQASGMFQLISCIIRSTTMIAMDFVFYGRSTVEGALAYSGLVSKFFIFITVMALAVRSGISRKDAEISLVWGIAAIFGAFAVIFASYVKYDNPGALRQITVTNAFLWTSLIGFACWAGAIARESSVGKWLKHDTLPGIALLGSLIVPVALIAPSVVHDYGIFSERQTTRDVLWHNGNTGVTIKQSPPGLFIGSEKLAKSPGVIIKSPKSDWADGSLLQYFETDRIEVLP